MLIETKPQPTKLSYEELESIVQAYRNGEPGASEDLLESFSNYLNRFKQVIKNGHGDITDKEIRNFVSLFMPKEKSAQLHQFRRNKNAVNDMHKTLGLIRSMFWQYSDEEIETELCIALYELARRYESHGNYFHIYMQRAYRFQLHRQLKKLLDSQFVTSSVTLPYFDEAHQDEDGDFSKGIIEASYVLVNEPLNDINENWVNGLTTSDVFYVLTRTQRRILKLYYVDDLTDDEIADYMGICRATANRRRQRAISAIAEQLRAIHVIE